ncbi:MAG: Translocation and assembly module TamB [Chlamydiae bacterium]|nr:Translocation and assembly module TamB [Chlamydiota bacterium]
MRKGLQLLLLFVLLFLLVGGALLQTPFVRKKLASWIEETSEGKLQVEKVEGFIPFWVKVDHISYQTNGFEIELRNVGFSLAPSSLLLGRLSIFRVEIEKGEIRKMEQNGEGERISPSWPSFPLPITVHSFHIKFLSFENSKPITLSGNLDLQEDFSFMLKGTSPTLPNTLFRVSGEGIAQEEMVSLIGRIQNPINHTREKCVDLWISGLYSWRSQEFSGSIRGKGEECVLDSPWTFRSDLSVDSFDTITLSSLVFYSDEIAITGNLLFSKESGHLQIKGDYLGTPLLIDTGFTWDTHSISLPALEIRFSDDEAKGNLRYFFKESSWQGKIHLNLHDLSPYTTESPISGSAEGELTIDGAKSSLTFTGSEIVWNDLSLGSLSLEGIWEDQALRFSLVTTDFEVLDPAYEVFPTAHLKLEGFLTSNSLHLDGILWGPAKTPFTLLADLSIRFSLSPFKLTLLQDAPLHLEAKGSGSIDPLLAFLENASILAQGILDLDVVVTGSWNEPDIQGTLHVEQGKLESLTTGAVFRNIDLQLQGRGRTLSITSLTATDLVRGSLSGTGELLWYPKKGFPFSLQVALSSFQILSTDPFTATVNSQLELSGSLQQISIQGTADIVQAHLSIPNKSSITVPVLDVIYCNPLPTPKPEIEKRTALIPIFWDIQVKAPENLTIEGRGLTSEWRGDLHITGEQNDLDYQGKLKLVQGRFTVVGKTFDLTEGKVGIEGIEPKSLYVDIKGDLELASLTASILIEGPLNDPSISFCSQRTDSTNEILSWILFNQDVNELSPFQAARLANVLVTLSGKSTGGKFFENLKEALGIDVFDITNCDFDSADFSFQIGKYISQGTFVGINKSISGDFDSLLIQTRLYRNFYLEADYGGSLNGLSPSSGKFILKWFKTY